MHFGKLKSWWGRGWVGRINDQGWWKIGTAATRRHRRKYRPGGRDEGGQPPDEWMEEVLISEVRNAERGTWETSVGLA